MNKSIPDIVFIIPYRDRLAQKEFFLRYMKYVLEDYDADAYEIVFCHQLDKRTFNRGAMKNSGFNYVKNKYPENYQKITLVFNDIDCVPYIKNLLDYKTSYGKIKHFYGFKYALGGIISITCHDFEAVNGFPNYWGWGFEDNALQNRLSNKGKYVSRKTFFDIGDNRILHLFDSFKKSADKNIPHLFSHDNGSTGISTLCNLKTTIQYMGVLTDHVMLNVKTFDTEYIHQENDIILRDIREKNDNTIQTTSLTSSTSPKRDNALKKTDTEPIPTHSNNTRPRVNSGEMIFNNISPQKCGLNNKPRTLANNTAPNQPNVVTNVANNPRARRHGGFSFGFKRG
jgi:hypothetical protein